LLLAALVAVRGKSPVKVPAAGVLVGCSKGAAPLLLVRMLLLLALAALVTQLTAAMGLMVLIPHLIL
jgi:hypothetical protein